MSHIKGWAIDANPKNDPTFPIRHRFPEDSTGYRWERPVQQGGSHGVFHSTERPDVTRVFGTSAPAHGLSGSIRRCAFKFSEGRFAHWLLLLAADRVNMMEGFMDDLVRGRATQCISDTGIKARWEHDRKALVTEAAVGAAVVGIFTAICFRRHLVPEKHHRLGFVNKRNILGLMDKNSKLQAFIRDYQRMMRP